MEPIGNVSQEKQEFCHRWRWNWTHFAHVCMCVTRRVTPTVLLPFSFVSLAFKCTCKWMPLCVQEELEVTLSVRRKTVAFTVLQPDSFIQPRRMINLKTYPVRLKELQRVSSRRCTQNRTTVYSLTVANGRKVAFCIDKCICRKHVRWWHSGRTEWFGLFDRSRSNNMLLQEALKNTPVFTA